MIMRFMNQWRHPILILAAANVAALSAEFKFGAQTITVPDGFEVQRVAGPPLVDRPIMADFDEQGRLYVADSAGVNDPPKSNSKTNLIASFASKTLMATACSISRSCSPTR